MFSIGFLTINIVILLGLFVVFFFITLLKGEQLLTRIIVTSYPTTLVYMYLPYNPPSDVLRIVTYIVLFVALYIVLGKYFTGKHSYGHVKKIYNAVLLALATVVTIITLYYQVLILESIYSLLTFSFLSVFNALPFGVWLMVPLALLAALNHGHHSS